MESTSDCNKLPLTGIRTRGNRKRKAEEDLTERMLRGEQIDEQPADFVYQDPVGDDAFYNDEHLLRLIDDVVYTMKELYIFSYIIVGQCTFYNFVAWEIWVCDARNRM